MSGRRKLLAFVLVPVALTALAALALVILVRPDALVEAALARARAATGYRIEAGPASLRLGFSGVGVRVADLEAASPDSSREFTAEAVDAYVKLRPLLSRRIELDRVVLHRPQLRVDEVGGSADGAGEGDGSEPLFAFLVVESWSIENGVFTRHAGDGRLELAGLDLRGGLRWTAGGGARGQAEGTVAGGEWAGGGVELGLPVTGAKVEFTLSAAMDTVTIADARFESGGVELELSGSYHDAGSGEWEGELSGRSNEVSLAQALALAPGELRGKSADYHPTGHLRLEELTARMLPGGGNAVTGLLSVREIAVALPGAATGVTGGEGRLRIDPEGIVLEEGRARIAGDPIRLKAAHRFGGMSEAGVRGRLSAATLTRVMPAQAGLVFDDGEVDMDLVVRSEGPPGAGRVPVASGTLDLIALSGTYGETRWREASGGLELASPGGNVAARGPVRFAELRHGDLVVRSVSGRVLACADSIRVDDVSAEVGGGRARGWTAIRPEPGGGWAYEGSLRLEDADLGEIVQHFVAGTRYVEGAGTAEAGFRGRRAPGEDPWRVVDADLHARITGGALVGATWLRELEPWLRLPDVIADRWPFRDLELDLQVRGGRIGVDSLAVTRPGLAAELRGAVSLDGTLDLGGTLRGDPEVIALPPELQLLAPYVMDAEGRVPVDFLLAGDFDRPVLSLDWEGLARRAGERAQQQEADRLRRELEKTITDPEVLDRIKKILGGNR